MTFGRVPVASARGAVLGHTLRLGGRVLKKGRVLSASDIESLRAAGQSEVVVARLEATDVPEDRAAGLLGDAAAGEGVRAAAATTGRCNLYSRTVGVALIDRARVDRLNHVDESVTVATVVPFALVAEGQMVATVKIIPFSVPSRIIETCVGLGREAPLIRVAPLRAARAGLLLTRLAGLEESVLDRGAANLRARVEALGSTVLRELRCAHEEQAVADAIRQLVAEGCSPVLVLGASAIVDRQDVVPLGIELAGGAVDHLGMPVDPGNLILLAHHGDTTVIGVPACARSPQPSGFDFVLQRVLAGVAPSGDAVMGMGVGGLLKEIPSRPQPREGPTGTETRAPRPDDDDPSQP